MTLEGSNFHQMVPNLKCNDMVSLITPQYGIWTLFIRLYTSENFFWVKVKQYNFTSKLCSNPPRVMVKLALQIKYNPPKFQKKVWE